MSKLTANINPEMLSWAREEMGLTPENLCKKIDIPIHQYHKWEDSGNSMPFGVLKEISRILKRQTAVFFLPETPPRTKMPHDYRNIKYRSGELSIEVRKAIRNADKYRSTASELRDKDYWKRVYWWESELMKFTDLTLTNSDIIRWTREFIDISLSQQLKFNSNSDAYRTWRSMIEDKFGVLVFQFSMPLNEVQGFCFSDYYPYAIVVNSKHSYTGRIFTLFHELGHIFKKQSGLCLPDFVDEQNQELEFECNRFSGNFLVPNEMLATVDSIEDLEINSRILKVSKEVYLRRLFHAEMIAPNRFFELLTEVQASYSKIPEKKELRIPITVRRKAERGSTFYNMVLEAVNKRSLPYSSASDLLGLNISKLMRELR